MSFPTQTLVFMIVAGISLAGGMFFHSAAYKHRWRTPLSVLRACYSTSVVCATVALLLFGDYLLNPI